MNLWTDQELDLLQTLAERVRLLRRDAFAQFWGEETLIRLEQAELVHRSTIRARRPEPRTKPLVIWRPMNPKPNLELLADQRPGRKLGATESVEVCSASKRACSLYGVRGGGLLPLGEQEHALGVSEVYLSYREHQPRLAQRWSGNKLVPGMPFDAVIVKKNGSVERAVKIFTSQPKLETLERLHEECKEWVVAYEIW